MTATAAPATPIPSSALVTVLTDDKVLAATRKLIDGKLRRQELLRQPNEDTSTNGQLHANAEFRARRDAHKALEELVQAVDAAAERFARDEASA